MARSTSSWREFQVLHKLEFDSVIRGYHAYMNEWSAVIGTKLSSAPDSRTEALAYDQTAVGVYHEDTLIGHVPWELSKLVHQFITKEGNRLVVEVTGKRKREVGLVLPAKYTVYTKQKIHALVFSDKLSKIQDKLGVEINFTPVNESHAFAVYDL